MIDMCKQKVANDIPCTYDKKTAEDIDEWEWDDELQKQVFVKAESLGDRIDLYVKVVEGVDRLKTKRFHQWDEEDQKDSWIAVPKCADVYMEDADVVVATPGAIAANSIRTHFARNVKVAMMMEFSKMLYADALCWIHLNHADNVIAWFAAGDPAQFRALLISYWQKPASNEFAPTAVNTLLCCVLA